MLDLAALRQLAEDVTREPLDEPLRMARRPGPARTAARRTSGGSPLRRTRKFLRRRGELSPGRSTA